jgi:hypothetical protein
MVRTYEIQSERWPGFLDTFNQRALGFPVRLEVANRDIGDQDLGRLLPFRGIDFESKGAERGDLIVHVGGDRDDLLDHRIDSALHLYVGENDAAEMEWLVVEDADHGKTFIYFEHLPAISAHEEAGTSAS